MSCEDFTQYRTFLHAFAYSRDEIWNVKFGSYSIDDSEIVAEAINWTLQYLVEGQCPTSLVTPIIKNIANEILNKDRKTETKDEFDFKSGNYKANELKRLVFELLKEYCSKLSDNVELNKILALTGDKNNDYPATYSIASIKNSRRTMEDRYICIDDLNGVYNVQNANQKVHLYAIFDGHNGHNAADYGASHLPFHIAKDPAYPSNPVEALRRAFITTDCNFVKKNIRSGTTALCALHYPQESKLLVAWVGDSKALLVKKGSILQLVIPHKPNVKEEADRIINQGGSIMTWGGTLRVKGLLNLSRALGDMCCKPFVISDPDIKCIELENEEDFLILASDGLWDHLSEEDSALAVYNYIKEKNKNSVANHLIELAKNSGSTDNITVIVVFLKKPSLIVKSFNNSTVAATETIKTESTSTTITTNMDMDTFDNRYSSDLNLDNTQTLVPNANTEIDIKTGPGKDIFQKDSLFNDGLNNLVDPSEPTSNNDTNNPFTTNFEATTDLIEDKNNIDLLSSFGGEAEYHQNNHHHHQDDNEILHHDLHHNIDSQKLNNDDDNKLLSSFENDMGPETSVDITDDVMMMTTENSETTDLLEHSALSYSKETLPSSDNLNPFDIKNSLQDFGGNTTDDIQNIEEAPTRTPTSPFEDTSPIPPLTEGIIISDDQHLIKNDDNGSDNIILDEDDEIGILTNKFDSMIVNDIKDNEQLIIGDEKDKDIVEKEIIENPENLENPSYIQNNDEQQIKKNDENLIDNFDEISKEKHFIENNQYNDVCDKENEYLIDDDYKNDDKYVIESETGPVTTTIQDTLVYEQIDNMSTIASITTTKEEDFNDNEVQGSQNAQEERIHDDEHFSNQQEEIDKFNLEDKENIEFSKEQFIPDQLQQHQELEQEQVQEEFYHQIQNQQQEEYQQQQQQSQQTIDEIHIGEHHMLLTDDMKAGHLKTVPEEEKISENLITGAESCDESEDEWKYMQLKEGEGEKNSIIRNDYDNSLLNDSITEETYTQQQKQELLISDNFEEFEENPIKEQYIEEVKAAEVISSLPSSQLAADSILEEEESNKFQEFEIKEEKYYEEESDLAQPQEQLSAAINSPSPIDFLTEKQQILLDSSPIIGDKKLEEVAAVPDHHHQEVELEEQQETEDMATKLNPDAKEFVPLGTSSNPVSDDSDLNVTNDSDIIINETNPPSDVKKSDDVEAEHPVILPSNGSPLIFAGANQHHLPNDDIIAQSPRKGVINMENIQIPDETEFQIEIHHRPSESPLSPESVCPTNVKVVTDDITHDENVSMNLKETMHAEEKEIEQISSSTSNEEEQCMMKNMENADMKESIYVENKNELNVLGEERMNKINELFTQNIETIHNFSFSSSENNDQNQVEEKQIKVEEEKAISNDLATNQLAISPAVTTTVDNESPATSSTVETVVVAAAVAAATVTAATIATVPTKKTEKTVDKMVQDKNLKNQNKVPAEGKKTASAKPSPTKKPTTTASKTFTAKTTTSRPVTTRTATPRTATAPRSASSYPPPARPQPQRLLTARLQTTSKPPKVETTITARRTVSLANASKPTNDQTKTTNFTNVGDSTRNPATASRTGVTSRPMTARPSTATRNAATTAATTTKSTTGVNQRVALTSTNKSTTLTKTTATSSLTQKKTEVQKSASTTKLKPVTSSAHRTSSSTSMTSTKTPPKSTSSITRKPLNLKAKTATGTTVKSSPSSQKIVATNGSAEPKLNGSATNEQINK